MCRLNAAEMFIDVAKAEQETATNWVAESGVLDLFLLLGPTPHQVIPASLDAPTRCAQCHGEGLMSSSAPWTLWPGRRRMGWHGVLAFRRLHVATGGLLAQSLRSPLQERGQR